MINRKPVEEHDPYSLGLELIDAADGYLNKKRHIAWNDKNLYADDLDNAMGEIISRFTKDQKTLESEPIFRDVIFPLLGTSSCMIGTEKCFNISGVALALKPISSQAAQEGGREGPWKIDREPNMFSEYAKNLQF